MATRKITPSTEPQRRCIGSAIFGIKPHQAALTDFPLQPSRKDGMGLMCKPHWTTYTRSLRQAARARQRSTAVTSEPDPIVIALDGVIGSGTFVAAEQRAGRLREPKPVAVDPAVLAAKALVETVEALPADEYVKRVGDDDVQAALAVLANRNGHLAPEPAA